MGHDIFLDSLQGDPEGGDGGGDGLSKSCLASLGSTPLLSDTSMFDSTCSDTLEECQGADLDAGGSFTNVRSGLAGYMRFSKSLLL